MAKEIERKFLVRDPEAARAAATGSRHIRQGYLSADPEATVRVRLADDRGYLTVKSRNRGAERDEWEYEIPARDAEEMLRLSRTPVIDKTRWLVPYGGHVWEVDEFRSPRQLIVAEVELGSADEKLELPAWVGEEVTGDPAYYNSNLARG